MLNVSATSCPHCGDPLPFGWDQKEFKARAVVHSILMLLVFILGFVVAIAPFGLIEKKWLGIVLFFVVCFLCPPLRRWVNKVLFHRVRHDIRHNLYLTLRSQYNYDLSPEQFEIWARKAEEYYLNARFIKGEGLNDL